MHASRAVGWLARTGWQVTRSLPGGALAERELLHLETVLVAGVRRRLDPAPAPAPFRTAMAELLDRSTTTDAAGAATDLYATILRQLVPDEARILAALADGCARPAVDVVLRNHLGNNLRILLSNASTIGRAAGVSAPEYVPAYVTRLHHLGVVDIGDEDPALAEQYDILLTDQVVRDAEDRARRSRRGGVKILRHTVAMSALGQRFWQASDPTTDL